MKKIILLTIFFVLLPSLSFSTIQDAIVQIFVTTADNKGKQGTGFFTSDTGQIVTAYHVVEGADQIKVVTADNVPYVAIRVDFISTQHDTAILQIMEKVSTKNFLEVVSFVPNTGEQVMTVGNPRGIPYQTFIGYVTSNKFIRSEAVSDVNGKPIFNIEKPTIDILGLDLTIYTGMSGAPIISRKKAIGVLSASLNEGGSFTWGVPVKYIMSEKYLQRIVEKPSKINWPKFDLLSTGTRSLEQLKSFMASDGVLLDRYFSKGENLKNRFDLLSDRFSSCVVSYNAWSMLFEKPNLSTEQKEENPLMTKINDSLWPELESCLISLITEMEEFSQLESSLMATHDQIRLAVNRLSKKAEIKLPSLNMISLNQPFPSIIAPSRVHRMMSLIQRVPEIDPNNVTALVRLMGMAGSNLSY
jgi:hypothetical protein